MLIPYSFKLGKKQYHVYRYNTPGTTLGQCFPEIQGIRVATTRNWMPRKPKDVAETFWHEVTHAILHDMGHKLWRDEYFVTEFSKRLNQVIHTARLDQ